MAENKVSMEVPVEFLNNHTKEEIVSVINSQVKLCGYLINGFTLTKEEFDKTVQEHLDKKNGGKKELIDIMKDLSKAISKQTGSDIKSDGPKSSKQVLDQVNHRFKVLDSSLPKYGGNIGENLEEWLLIIQGFLDIGNYSPLEALLAVLPLLKENALQQFIAFRKNFPYEGWGYFVDHLRRVFRPFDVERRIRVELRQMKYTGNFDKFALKFQQLANKLNDMPEKELIFLFLEAMPPKTRYEVLSKDVRNLADAIRFASIYEECCRDNQSHEHKVNYSKVQFPKRKRFFQQKTNSNNFRPSEKSFQKRDKDRAKIKCYKCNREGHMANNCRVRTQGKPVSVNEVTELKQKMEKVLTCENEENSLLCAYGTISGIKLKLYFDSGATASILSARVAHEYGIKMNPSEVKVKLADNATTNVVGKTDELLVEINGHTCYISFLVLEHDDHDALLGLDWFSATGAGLYPAMKLLRFPGQNVYLDKVKQISVDNEEPYEVLISEVLDEPDIEEETSWEFTKKPIIEVQESELNSDQKKTFEKVVLPKIKEVSAKDINDLGECTLRKHHIRTQDVSPIFIQPYRKSMAEREGIKKEVEEMLQADIIEQSTSPWSSPVVLVPKKNGKKRFCVDFRKLNAVTITENWPLPRIEDIFDRLGDSKVFSTLDLKSGYWQMGLTDESKEKTAFSTPDGHYQFKRMPFGLKNAPADFSKLMYQILGNLPYVEIYLDDITIHSKQFNDHVKHVTHVLSILKSYNLKINPEKCSWFADTIKLLGHIISESGVAMDPDKIEAIKVRLPPKNIKQIQQFLGICNYYRRFIKDYAKIAEPLTRLLRKEEKFEWNNEQQNSFEELKKKLTEYPILRQPEVGKKFLLYTDASGYALGAILSQKDSDDKEYVCAYASRTLKGAELNYGITEKECLAVVWAIKQFRIYLYGNKFQVITDHSALSWLMNITDPTGRLARWAIYLQAYEFEIIHRKGNIHSNADTLSRPVLKVAQINTILTESESPKILDVYDDDALLHRLKMGKHLPGLAAKQVKRVDKLIEHYQWKDNQLLYKPNVEKEEYLVVPKRDERRDVIEKAHLLGHFQAEATAARVREKYFWRGMIKDIEKIIKLCKQCKEYKVARTIDHPAKALEILSIFHRIGIDLVFGLPLTPEGHKGLLVIIEFVSKYVWATPIKSKNAEEIAEKLLVYIALFGPSKEILSDQGTEFNNKVVEQLMKATGVVHRVTSAYNPRTNGQTERMNYVLVESLAKFTGENNLDWPKWLPYVLLSYNTKVHSSTGFTPFELMFGRKMNGFDSWKAEEGSNESDMILKRSYEIKALVEDTQPKAIENIKKNKETQIKIQNNRENVTEEEIPVGKSVYMKTEGIHDKLYPKYKGPFKVTERTAYGNYKLKDQMGNVLSESFPRHKLKEVEEEDDQEEVHYEIEKIVNHKKQGKGFRYFVKWKGYPESENTWEPPENFDDKTILTKYWKNIEGVDEKKTKRTRTEKSNSLLYTLTMFMLFFLLNPILALKVNDTFYYCNTQQDNPIFDVDGSCMNPTPEGRLLRDKAVYSEVFVLSKKIYEVHGKAYQCKKEIIQMITSENFFGAKSKEISKVRVEMTPTECETMVKEKKCGEKKMNCDDDGCYLDNAPEEEYKWLGSFRKEGLRCSLKNRVITARSKDETLFHRDCKAKDLYCRLEDSIIVWAGEIINKCPYSFITNESFSHQGDDIIYNSQSRHLFKLTNKFIECEMEIYGTTEGLYITWSQKAKQLEKSEVELSTIHDLILSEQDGAVYNAYLNRENMNMKICETIKTYLRELRVKEDVITLVGNNRGFATIIHAQSGIIRLPTCVVMDVVEILDVQDVQSNVCTMDLLVKFELENKTHIGFLTDKNIVRAVPTKEEKCLNPLYRYFHKNKVLIKRENNKITRLKDVETIEIGDLDKRDGSINFPHYKRILEQIDVLSEIKNSHSDEIEEIKSKILFKEKSEEKNIILDEFSKIKDSTLTIIQSYKIKIAIYIVSIIIILTILFILIAICYKRVRIISWIMHKTRQRDTVRLDPITQEYLRLTKLRNEEL
jgi:hypothetical protein